jgi:hypothetical protein
MIPVIIDLPYAMLASLEAAARSGNSATSSGQRLSRLVTVRRTMSQASARIDLQRPRSASIRPARQGCEDLLASGWNPSYAICRQSCTVEETGRQAMYSKERGTHGIDRSDRRSQ